MQWPVSQIATLAPERARQLRELDKTHLWHPFTQMRDWMAPDHDPIVIARGEGAMLYDCEGVAYLDGNSSIWTNVHGHCHPTINAAIEAQLGKIAHCSALGFTNEPAIELAQQLLARFPGEKLSRVFFSDDGSTAVECACKMALQFHQLRGEPQRARFLAFDGAYHGDTMGAASLGGIQTFQARFADFGFQVERAASLDVLTTGDASSLAAVTIEPLIQGANRMRTWPSGMLAELSDWCEGQGALLIVDEVMTGFGKTGTMFACEQEGVTPDIIALAKGLTGGYLPLAATLATETIFEAFLGDYEESKTFFYGHSYCGNPLGCAAALANLDVFRSEDTLAKLQPKIRRLQQLLADLSQSPHVSAIRQCGFITGIDLCRIGGEPFDPNLQIGSHVCVAARKHGLLTRPILDTIVLMPPLCTTEEQLEAAVSAIAAGVDEVCSTP